jgi:hypothetical protein
MRLKHHLFQKSLTHKISWYARFASISCLSLGWPLHAEEAVCRLPSQAEETEVVSTEVASTEVASTEINAIKATNTVKDFDFNVKTNQWHDFYPNATEVQQLETRFTPGTSSYEGTVTAAETEGMLSRFKSFGSMAKAGGEALGPIFDAVMLGVWVDKMATTFHSTESTTLDKVSSTLMLVPIAGDIARTLADDDHFDRKVQADLKALASESTYIYKNFDEASIKQANKISQMLNYYDIYLKQAYEKTQLVAHKSAVLANLRFQVYSLALIDNLDHTLNRMDTGYFKHLYYNLYRAPYALSEQTKLAMSPLTCQPDVLNYRTLIDQVDRPKMEAMLAQLNDCLNTVVNQGLSPINDLLLDQNPNITLDSWNERGHDLVRTKIQMIQNTKDKLSQDLVGYREYYNQSTQEELQPTYQSLSEVTKQKAAKLFPLTLKHWAHTSFPDIDEEGITLDYDNYDDATLTLKPPKTCQDIFKHVPICYVTQFISDTGRLPDIVKFDVLKSPYLNQFQQSTNNTGNDFQYLMQPEMLEHLFKDAVINEVNDHPLRNYVNAFLHLRNKYKLAADNFDILSDHEISSIGSSGMPLSADEAVNAQAQEDNYAYMRLVSLKRNAPLLYQRLHILTSNIGADQVNETKLFTGLFQYPYNQTWYITKHYSQLGDFVHFFITNNLQAIDTEKQVDLAFTDNIQLPPKMERLIDPVNQELYQRNAVLNSAEIALDQAKLAAILSSATSTESKLTQNCAQYDDNLQRLNDVKNRTLSYLPFWYPIVSEWHRVYAQYHYVMMPLCRALNTSAQPSQP